MLIHSRFTIWLAVRATRFVAYLLRAGKKIFWLILTSHHAEANQKLYPIKSAQKYLEKISVEIRPLTLSGISVT